MRPIAPSLQPISSVSTYRRGCLIAGSVAISAVNWARFRLGVPWALTGGEIDEPWVLGSAKRDTMETQHGALRTQHIDDHSPNSIQVTETSHITHNNFDN